MFSSELQFSFTTTKVFTLNNLQYMVLLEVLASENYADFYSIGHIWCLKVKKYSVLVWNLSEIH